MPIAPFPHHYVTALAGNQLEATSHASIRIGAPPEFGGRDDVWSPEQLLLGAALACLKTTFDAYAARAGLHVDAWRGTAAGTLEKGRSSAGVPGVPVFTSIRFTVEVETAPGEEARTKELLETADKHCIVSRALAVPVELSANVHATAAPPTRAVS